MTQPSRRRRWLPILAGVGILLVFLCIGAVIAVVSVVRETVHVDAIAESDATSEFDKVRAQFAGRAPLLEFAEGGRPQVSESAREAGASTARLDAMNMLAWDPKERRLVRFSLPFWLLRLKSGPIAFSGYASGLDDRVSLRVEDIERYGPGIIVDHTTPSGQRVLFWAQ